MTSHSGVADRVVFFEEEFPSTIESMTRALERTVKTLAARGWIRPDQECRARLCLEEALVNAVRHGNGCDSRRNVRIELSAEDDLCYIRVFDEGAGFSLDQVREPAADQMGGRGICLMRHYMERIAYDKDKKCLEMAFRRGKCEKGA